MLKKLLCLVMAMMLGLLACACGSDKGSSTDTSSAASDSGVSDTASTGTEEPAADATLTVTVKKGDIQKFKSDRPYDSSKEDISLILVIGQSNFTPSVGFASEYGGLTSGKIAAVSEEPVVPAKGTVYSGGYKSAITALTDERDAYNLCNTSRGTSTLGGVTPSFGIKWHELTGTKVVFVQAAVGAVGVHEWTPEPEYYVCECTNNGQGKLYSDAVAIYKRSYEALAKDYNIVYTGYIWNQGEHDEFYGKADSNVTVNSDETYYVAYKSMHDGLMADLDLDFGGISVVRADKAGSTAQGSMSLTIARNAQYKLCNDIDNLYMLSTISETCDHSVMDQTNTIHYSQMIFNKMGAECADNLAKYLGISQPAEFKGIQIYSSVGIKLFEFDASGNVFSGDSADVTDTLGKGLFTNHILTKLSTLGTGYTIAGYKLTVGDKDVSECIDEFGAINWNAVDWKGIGTGITPKTVQVKCVIE